MEDQYLYHVAPTADRARIQSHGLRASTPSLSPHWGEGEVEQQPTGIYTVTTPQRARQMARWYSHPGDVWRIPREAVQEYYPDPALDYGYTNLDYPSENHRYYYIPHDIPNPELHLPAEQNKIYQDPSMPDYKPDFTEWMDLPPEYGIGFPDRVIGNAKTAIDWMGDAYRQDRTEEQTLQKDYTETQFDDPQDHVEEQNWILTGNHVLVTQDDPSTMFGRMGFGDTDQPHAYGTVDLYYNYEAMFSVERSNIAAHVVERALRKFCKQNDLAFEGLLSQDGTLFSSKDSSIKTAEVPGVGRQLPEKLWRIHYDGEDQPVDFYGEQDDDWNEDKPQGPMECPLCSEMCNSYGDFLVHENKEHSDGLSIPDSPQPVVDMDDVMPAHWNTSPSGDSTIKRQASWTPSIVVLAGQGLIPGPIPFVFDVENDIIHTGHPGEKHSDIKTPGKLTVNVVEGLYTPDKKIQFKTDSTMPYSVRHMILLWYHLYPELEVKHVEKLVGDKKHKLAKKNIGQRVRDLAFTDQAVREAYSALSQYANVYAVGGAVRDIVLGHIPKDIDLLAQGIPPQQIETLLQTLPGRVDFTGKAFGVFRYKAEDGSEVEIALPQDRNESPDPFLSVEEDLARRDFTGNAMAVSLQTGELSDPYNGQADLSQGKLKAVNPQAFKDDPLRILRAFSAMSRQGLRPDEETEKEIRKESYRLRALPAERLQMELDKIFAGKDPEGAIRAMRDTGVLHYVLPEVAATIDFDQKNKHHRKMLDEHLLDVLRRAAEESGDPDLRLAALLHDIGKPASQWMDEEGNGHYYRKIHLDPVTHKPTGEESGANHHEVGAQMTNDLMERLKYPKSRIDRVKHLVNHHMFNPFDNPKGARKFINQVGPEHANDLLTLRRADQEGKGTDEWENQTPVALQRQLVDRVNQEDEATQVSDLAVNGNDLIKEGIPASPEMGRILNKLLEAVLERPELNTPEQLLEMARSLHMMKDASVQKDTNILDEIKDSLDEQVFTNADADMPKLKPKIRHYIKKSIYKVLRDNGYPDPENWLHLILTGSLTTYQWSPASDFDVSLWVDFENIPDWRRADLISLMVHHLDGVTVPGTTHTLQAYVVPEHVGCDDLYRPGLRSAYDIDKDQWMILPEKSRTIDVNKEMRSALIYAKEMAYKMKLLILYDMPGAKEFWRQLHQRRKQDMAAGKGDYSNSNVVWKYLEKHFLDPTKVVTTKTAADNTMYHVAPRSARERYLKEGITPKNPGFEDNPTGTYMWEFDPRSDPRATDVGAEYDPNAGDLYAINVEGLPLQPDNWLPHAHYTDQPIPPNRIRLLSDERTSAFDAGQKVWTPEGQLAQIHRFYRTMPGIQRAVVHPVGEPDPTGINERHYNVDELAPETEGGWGEAFGDVVTSIEQIQPGDLLYSNSGSWGGNPNVLRVLNVSEEPNPGFTWEFVSPENPTEKRLPSDIEHFTWADDIADAGYRKADDLGGGSADLFPAEWTAGSDERTGSVGHHPNDGTTAKTAKETPPAQAPIRGQVGEPRGAKTAMADRSGIPEIDALIEAFLKEPQGDWTTDEDPYEALRDPSRAAGSCEEVTEHFVEFAKQHGLKAYVTHTDLDEMGYQTTGDPAGEVLDEEGNIVPGFYHDHTVAEVYSPGVRWPVYVDFTATQYGYTDHPKVTSKVDWRKKYNYRNAEGENTCGSCAALDKYGRCAMFNSFVKKSSVCNEWTDSYTIARTGSTPVTLQVAHNSERAPDMGEMYGQHLEPAGRYLVAREEGGSITFQNPLYIPWGDQYSADNSWKRVLAEKYGVTGDQLTAALLADGYDGVITTTDDGMSEIVDLQSDRATPLGGDEVTAKTAADPYWKQIREREPGIPLTHLLWEPMMPEQLTGLCGQNHIRPEQVVQENPTCVRCQQRAKLPYTWTS